MVPTNMPYIIDIQSTIFEYFSNCGSLISNVFSTSFSYDSKYTNNPSMSYFKTYISATTTAFQSYLDANFGQV